MSDLFTLLPAAGLGGLATFIGQTTFAYFKTRGDRKEHKEDAEFSLKQHTDQLMLDMVQVAREEVAAARVETAGLRTLQLRLVHFDEAMEHIQALINTSDDPEARKSAERRATQFMTRMKRFSEANGTARNEVQIQDSRSSIVGDNLKKAFPADGNK